MRASLLLFRHRLEHLGFLAVVSFFRMMPLETAADVSARIWRFVAPRTRRHARALRHLRAADPTASDAELDALARRMWDHLGRTFAEAIHLERIAKSPDRLRMAAPAEWARLAADPRPKVLVSLHQGNWELAAAVAQRQGLHGVGVYQRVQNPLIDRWLHAHRAALYPAGLLTKSHETPRRVMRTLRAGGALFVMADLREARGVEVPFFGRPAPSTTFPALMARSCDAQIIAARVVREPGTHFTVEVAEVPAPRTENRDADILAATAGIQRQFEAWIRQAPEQWMWAHKRWGRDAALEPLPAPAADVVPLAAASRDAT